MRRCLVLLLVEKVGYELAKSCHWVLSRQLQKRQSAESPVEFSTNHHHPLKSRPIDNNGISV
jgi:hypothetical protein